MKPSRVLAITSLMSILLFSFHLAGDIVRGIEKGQLGNLPAIAIFAVWMYGAVMLSERRIGYAITFLGSLLSLAVPILHLMGRGVGVESSIARSPGGFFFIWIVFALGTTALFSVILAARALWSPEWATSRDRTV